MKERLLTNWHPMRMLRVAVGIAALVAAIQSRDMFLGAVSLFLLYQGITNTGCCGTMGCYAPARKKHAETESIDHEEIK